MTIGGLEQILVEAKPEFFFPFYLEFTLLHFFPVRPFFGGEKICEEQQQPGKSADRGEVSSKKERKGNKSLKKGKREFSQSDQMWSSNISLTNPVMPTVLEANTLQLAERNETMRLQSLKQNHVNPGPKLNSITPNYHKEKKDLKDVKVRGWLQTAPQSVVHCACVVAPITADQTVEKFTKSPKKVATEGSSNKDAAEENYVSNERSVTERSVWCGESDGSITIRSPDTGDLQYSIVDPKEHCVPTAMIHAPLSVKLTKEVEEDVPLSPDASATPKPKKTTFVDVCTDFVWVGFNDGSIRIYRTTDNHLRHHGAFASEDDYFYVFEPSKQHKSTVTCFTLSPRHFTNDIVYKWRDETSVVTAKSQTVDDILKPSFPRARQQADVTVSLLCSGSSDSCIVVWDLVHTYCKVDDVTVKQQKLKRAIEAAQGGVKVTDASLKGPEGATRLGPVTHFKCHMFGETDETRDTSYSFCTMISLRPLLRLKGSFAGIRTLNWVCTAVAECPLSLIPKGRPAPKPEDPDDDDTPEQKLVRRTQTKLAEEKKAEECKSLEMTPEEHAGATEKVDGPQKTRLPAFSEEELACNGTKIDFLVSGDDDGNIAFWDLGDELTRKPPTEEAMERSASQPRSARSASASRRAFMPASLSPSRSRSPVSARYSDTSSVTGSVISAGQMHRTTNKQLGFRGGFSVCGLAACLPKSILVPGPELPPQKEGEQKRDANEIKALLEKISKAVSMPVALYNLFKHLELFVAVSDGSFHHLQCNPTPPNEETKEQAEKQVEHHSPSQSVSSPLEGHFTYPTFSVFFDRQLLQHYPESLNTVFYEPRMNNVWVCGGDAKIIVWDVKTLRIACCMEGPSPTQTTAPPSVESIQASIDLYSSGYEHRRIATSEKRDVFLYFISLIAVGVERFPRYLAHEKDAVTISTNLTQRQDAILENEGAITDRVLSTKEQMAKREEEKKAEKELARQWQAIVFRKDQRIGERNQKNREEKDSGHIYFFIWRVFVAMRKRQRRSDSDKATFEAREKADKSVADALHGTVVELARRWKRDNQLVCEHFLQNRSLYNLIGLPRYVKLYFFMRRSKQLRCAKFIAQVIYLNVFIRGRFHQWMQWAADKVTRRVDEIKRQAAASTMLPLQNKQLLVTYYEKWVKHLKFTKKMTHLKKQQKNAMPLLEFLNERKGLQLRFFNSLFHFHKNAKNARHEKFTQDNVHRLDTIDIRQVLGPEALKGIFAQLMEVKSDVTNISLKLSRTNADLDKTDLKCRKMCKSGQSHLDELEVKPDTQTNCQLHQKATMVGERIGMAQIDLTQVHQENCEKKYDVDFLDQEAQEQKINNAFTSLVKECTSLKRQLRFYKALDIDSVSAFDRNFLLPYADASKMSETEQVRLRANRYCAA